MGMRCWISRGVLEQIRRESDAAAPFEACGLLFGSADAIVQASVARNVADAPERRFEIDPAALFAALKAERADGPGIAGYWHSHPSGSTEPSACDAAMAAPDGKLWLILGEGESLWQATITGLHGRFEPVEILPDG
jgi:proteasome lid subunit RPN8/RPN11